MNLDYQIARNEVSLVARWRILARRDCPEGWPFIVESKGTARHVTGPVRLN